MASSVLDATKDCFTATNAKGQVEGALGRIRTREAQQAAAQAQAERERRQAAQLASDRALKQALMNQ